MKTPKQIRNKVEKEEVICNYDIQECEKCSRTDCMIKVINNDVVSIQRVPELEDMLNKMVKEVSK
jgi:hypothetical protein